MSNPESSDPARLWRTLPVRRVAAPRGARPAGSVTPGLDPQRLPYNLYRRVLMTRVYVSSTYQDLEEFRRHAEVALRRMGHIDIAMEYYVAEERPALEKCLDDVASCDLYIGIFAWRYGWIPERNNPEKRAITELEYRQAIACGKPCFIFLLDAKAAWPPDFIDDDRAAIKRLRNELAQNHIAAYFETPKDLAAALTQAVSNWERRQGASAAPAGPEFHIARYYEALRKRYRRVDLDSLTPVEREEYLQVELRSIFIEPDVREDPPPLELPGHIREKLESEHQLPAVAAEPETPRDIPRARAVYFERPARPVLDTLSDPGSACAVVLGDPGSGKSTLARYLAVSLADPAAADSVPAALKGHFPLLIELRHYARVKADRKCDTFFEFLEYLGKTEGWHLAESALRAFLKNNGKVLAVFDGLDEIFDPAEREQTAVRIAGFASDYPGVRILVTSRIIGYRRKVFSDAGFAQFTIQDLDESQVKRFVGRWYELAVSEHAAAAGREREHVIMRAYRESASIRQLAGNPMLLTIMLIISRNRELPRERWRLYDHAAAVLIQHWDVNKHLHSQALGADILDEEDKKELLRRLALNMQRAPGGLAGNVIHRDTLQAEFESYLRETCDQTPARASKIARAMIAQFEERNFILSAFGPNLYGFVHRAFLEFFCAAAFVHQFEKARTLSLDQLEREVFGAHWADLSWHEVLRLICGMIGDKPAAAVSDYLLAEARPAPGQEVDPRSPWNVALAVRCLAEMRNLAPVADTARRALATLCTLFDSVDIDPKFLAGELVQTAVSIGANWPHRPVLTDWLRKRRASATSWFSIDLFGRFVGAVAGGSGDVRAVLLDYLAHRPGNYRAGALLALAGGWHDDPRTLTILRDRAVNDPDHDVRSAALIALSENCAGDPETAPLLRQRAAADRHWAVRSAALFSLARQFATDPGTLVLLHQRLRGESSPRVQRAIREALAECFSDDAQTLPLLLDSKARHALSDYLGDTPLTLPLLLEQAIHSPSGDLRTLIVRILAEHFPELPQVFPLLRDRAAKDLDVAVRRAAVSALLQHFPAAPHTFLLLRERAVEEPDLWLRGSIPGALASRFHDEPATFPFLRERLFCDPDEHVRYTLLHILVAQYPDPCHTYAAIRDRAEYDPSEWVRNSASEVLYEASGEQRPYRAGQTESPLPSLIERRSREVLDRYWDSRAKFPDLLYEDAVADPRPWVRSAVLVALAARFPQEPRVLPLLHERASADSHALCRAAALRALAPAFTDHPQLLPLLLDRAIHDPEGPAREAAIDELAARFPAVGRTLPLIRDRACTDHDPLVRRCAVLALAETFPHAADTVRILDERARADEDENVRRAALEILAARFRAGERTLPLLRDAAVMDDSPWVRRAAIEHLAVSFRAYQVDDLLLRCRTDDPDSWVRDFAARCLHMSSGTAAEPAEENLPATGDLPAADDAPEIPPLPLLLSRFADSTDPEARAYALCDLARYYSNRPETVNRLVAAAVHDPSPEVRRFAGDCLLSDFPKVHLRFEDWENLLRCGVGPMSAISRVLSQHPDDPRTLDLLRSYADSPDDRVRVHLLETLGRVQNPDSRIHRLLLERARNDPFPDARSAALHALSRTFADSPASCAAFADAAENDPEESIREAALYALTDCSCNHPRAWPALRHYAFGPYSDRLVHYARIALCRWFKDDPRTFAAFAEAAARGSGSALYDLARYYPDRPATLEHLLAGATRSRDNKFRTTAIGCLVEHFAGDYHVLPLLLKAAVDRDPKIRSVALRSLGSRPFVDDPQTQPCLAAACNDPDPGVRRLAGDLLVWSFPQHPQCLGLLRDRVKSGEKRVAALESLAKYFPEDPGLPPFLFDRATNDPDHELRATALRLAVQLFPKLAETGALVLDRARNDPDPGPRIEAVDSLQRGIPSGPIADSLLREIAVTDGAAEVRSAAAAFLNWRHPIPDH
jgi:HEAT repeat protein